MTIYWESRIVLFRISSDRPRSNQIISAGASAGAETKTTQKPTLSVVLPLVHPSYNPSLGSATTYTDHPLSTCRVASNNSFSPLCKAL